MTNPFTILRLVAYFKRLTLATERLADAAERAYPPQRRARLPLESGVASVTEWNERYQREQAEAREARGERDG